MRTTLRTSRKALSSFRRHLAGKRLLHYLLTTPLLRHTTIALYIENDGEISTQALIQTLMHHRKQIYVPVLHQEKLRFARLSAKMRPNRFGILEPMRCQFISVKRLNSIIMPLVGFDEKCNRMGMGGGFYDKTLAFKHKQQRYCYPKLYGVAYELQKTTLNPKLWDIPLDKVITDRKVYK